MEKTQNQLKKTTFINPYSDFAFKFIFGKEPNKDLLIDFLNGIFKGRKVIIDLEYSNIEHKGPGLDYRKTLFDLYCTGDQGEKFIVEMQKSKPDNFKDRSIFYTSNLIQEQGISVNRDWDYLLPEIYFVAIMDFSFEDTHPDHYIHDVRLIEINTGEQFYNKLGYIFIEMPKFKKTEAQLKTDQDGWLFLLNNLNKLEKIPLSLSKKKEFIKLLSIARLSNLNKDDMNAYQESLKVHRDNYSVRQAAIKEGKAEGLMEGKAEGLVEGKAEGLMEGKAEGLMEGKAKGELEKALEIAVELKKLGLSIVDIAKSTKLSVQEIEKL